jgi:sugar lactone lactonase YvrE
VLLTLGEGPVWDPPRQRLLWVDIARGRVFQGHLNGDSLVISRDERYDQTVGAVVPARDGGLVIAGTRELHLVGPDGDVQSSIPLIDLGERRRLNDAVCDAAGRLLVGTLSLDGDVGGECVFRVNVDGTVSTVVSDLTLANGMAFSPDDSTLYLVDSVPGVVHAFAYDVAVGELGERRTVWQGDLVPDGLTVDSEGMLWVAFFGAGCVQRMTPQGELLAIVRVPAPNTTCPAFVGADLDRLLVTTAREQLTDDELASWPDSGGVFLADPGVRGVPGAEWGGSTMRKTGQ